MDINDEILNHLHSLLSKVSNNMDERIYAWHNDIAAPSVEDEIPLYEDVFAAVLNLKYTLTDERLHQFKKLEKRYDELLAIQEHYKQFGGTEEGLISIMAEEDEVYNAMEVLYDEWKCSEFEKQW